MACNVRQAACEVRDDTTNRLSHLKMARVNPSSPLEILPRRKKLPSVLGNTGVEFFELSVPVPKIGVIVRHSQKVGFAKRIYDHETSVGTEWTPPSMATPTPLLVEVHLSNEIECPLFLTKEEARLATGIAGEGIHGWAIPTAQSVAPTPTTVRAVFVGQEGRLIGVFPSSFFNPIIRRLCG